MRLVVPIGPARPTTLPYVLRSLAANAGVTELVTIGNRPDGIEADRHIDSPNTGKPHLNVAGHLRRAAELGGPFIWCDDDTFTMKPWTPAVYVRDYTIAGMLRLYPNRGAWSQAVRTSMRIMTEWGFDPETVPCGTVHRPWLVDSDRVMMVVDALDAMGGGSFKALYVAGLDGVVVGGDPKVIGRGVPRSDADVISTDHHSWRYNAGRIIRAAFPEPSRWEALPDTVPALSGHARGPHRHRRR